MSEAQGKRAMPKNLDAERAVLGSLLVDPERIAEAVELLSREDFFHKGHGAVFAVLEALSEKAAPVDLVTVSQALRAEGILAELGGEEFLVGLVQSVTSSAHLLFHSRIVADNAVLRSLIGETTDILTQAFETAPDGENVQALLDDSENRIFRISRTRDTEGAESVSEVITEVFRRIDARSHRQGLTGLETGFYELDEKLCGMNAGDLIVLAARPSMGKTALALNLLENSAMCQPDWMERKPTVLLFSLEMGRISLLERMLCSRAGVEAHRLRSGRLATEERQALTEAADELQQCNILIDDSPGLSMMSLRSRARRVRAQYGLDAIFVDYLQLLSFPRAESRQQEISSISRSLKALARELNIPIIALAQLSRAVELRDPPRPQLADLRESGSIEQDADVVLLLYRAEYYPKFRDDPEHRDKAEIIIAKHRNGPTGAVGLQFFASTMRFRNPTADHVEAIMP